MNESLLTHLNNHQYAATWLVALGTLLVIVIALTSGIWHRLLFGPRLRLSYGSDDQYVTNTFLSPGKIPARYYRIKVRNRRRAVARECHAYLVNVESFSETSGKWEETIYCDSIPLAWACQGTAANPNMNIDIPSGVNHYVDVLATRQDSEYFETQTKSKMNRYSDLFTQNGKYRFTILVSGDEVRPARIKICFTWTGAWDQAVTDRCKS